MIFSANIFFKKLSRSSRGGSADNGYPDYRARRAADRAQRRLEERQVAKQAEQAKEELYDRMMNPHLYGAGGGGYRKLKRGEHYEDVQKKELDDHIREKEREERRRMREREREQWDRGYHHHNRHHRQYEYSQH